MSDSLQSHGLQPTRLPCPWPSPGACSNSCPLSWWCHPTSCSLSSPSSAFNLSQHQGIFQWVSSSIRWPNIGASASASVLPMNIQLISFRIDWFDLHAVRKSLLQNHSSKASIIWFSAFFMVHLSHLYMTTGKTIALTRRFFVGKVMSLLFNILSRFVIAFLPRSKCLLISWLQSPSAVILEPKKVKSVTVSIVSPSTCHEMMRPDAMILVFECWVIVVNLCDFYLLCN